METRVCKQCGCEKPITEYYFRNDKHRHQHKCKPCYNRKKTPHIKRGFDALQKQTQDEIKNMLQLGVPKSIVSKKYDIKYNTFLSWRITQ